MPTSPAELDAEPHPSRTRSGSHGLLPRLMRQLVLALLTLLTVSAVTYLATNIKSPEDVARSAIGRQAAPEQIAVFVREHDLAAPLPGRYVAWLGDFVQGDWGKSVITDRPIAPELLPRVGRTLLLVGLSLLVVLPVGIAFGGYLAGRWGSRFDVVATGGLVVLLALPEFVIGVGVILLFSVLLGVLPPNSAITLSFGAPWEKAGAYILPAITLVLVSTPFMTRMTRASARDSLLAPHTRAATLRGLPRRTVLWDYGMRTAALPIVSAAGLTLVHMLSGTIVVENVFSFPGIGQALVSAIGTGDTVAVQAIAVVTAALFVAASLAADLLAMVFNPRLRNVT